jgi:hypothetical protein
MPLVVVVLAVVWAACMFFGFLYGLPVAGVVTVVVTTLAGVGHYFVRAGHMLGPGRDEGESEVVPARTGAGKDPVYRHYLFLQMPLDAWRVPRTVVPELATAGWRAVARVSRWLAGGVQGFFLLPIWLGVVAGVVVAAVPLAAAALAVAVAHLLVFAVGGLLWLTGVVLLRGVESVVMLARRILQTCPHPQCYARISLPEYACPTCDERHRTLRPNLDGALRHVCRCGTRLPTAIVLGRFRLRAYCPQCHRALPHRIGRARVEPLPFIGGPDAGKTTLMILAINALHAAVRAAGGRAGFVVEGDQQAFARLSEELRLGRVSKTTTAAPSATMVDIALPRAADRILYLFDPSGEGFTGATEVEAMSYLAHGEAMLIVVDPFALPLVQHGLTGDERRVLEKAGVVLSPEDPSDTFQRVRNELAARTDGGRQKRVAVVVSKADLLRKTVIGQDSGRLPEWFDSVGLGNMVRDLARSAGEVRYLASGFPPDFPAIATMLAWLTALPLNGHASAVGTVGAGELPLTDLRPPWTPRTRRPALAPLGHLLYRRSLLATSAVLTLTALTLLTAWAIALIRPLLPI